MFLVPKSEVTIGKQKFYGDNTGIVSLEIQQSVDRAVGSASITLPRNFKRKGWHTAYRYHQERRRGDYPARQ